MSKIYVVIEHTGEYSDRNERLIRAFHSEVLAKELISNLENWVKKYSNFNN